MRQPGDRHAITDKLRLGVPRREEPTSHGQVRHSHTGDAWCCFERVGRPRHLRLLAFHPLRAFGDHGRIKAGAVDRQPVDQSWKGVRRAIRPAHPQVVVVDHGRGRRVALHVPHAVCGRAVDGGKYLFSRAKGVAERHVMPAAIDRHRPLARPAVGPLPTVGIGTVHPQKGELALPAPLQPQRVVLICVVALTCHGVGPPLPDDIRKHARGRLVEPEPGLDRQRVTSSEVEWTVRAGVDDLQKPLALWQQRSRTVFGSRRPQAALCVADLKGKRRCRRRREHRLEREHRGRRLSRRWCRLRPADGSRNHSKAQEHHRVAKRV